jgi:hypothetical protein
VSADAGWWPLSSLSWWATGVVLFLTVTCLFLLIALASVFGVADWGELYPGPGGDLLLLAVSLLFYAGCFARWAMIWRQVFAEQDLDLGKEGLLFVLGSLATVAVSRAWYSLGWMMRTCHEHPSRVLLFTAAGNFLVLFVHEAVLLWLTAAAYRRGWGRGDLLGPDSPAAEGTEAAA